MPIDVLVTVAVNSGIDQAHKVRREHRAIAAACDPLLKSVPAEADLIDYDVSAAADLLHAAVQCERVGFAVATKVLHRKRRALIPMLDSVVINHYLGRTRGAQLPERIYKKTRARANAIELLGRVREDLVGAAAELGALRHELHAAGFPVTELRALDALLWTELEGRAAYRV